jgi:hypothetical protein
LLESGNKDRARKLTGTVLAQAVTGPETAYIPAGERPGQRSGVIETTARTLETLVALGENSVLQTKLARWLLLPPDDEGRPEPTPSEQAELFAPSCSTVDLKATRRTKPLCRPPKATR